MVRVGGMNYTINPNAAPGNRISDMYIAGKKVEANKNYMVAGWASVQQGVEGTPIWDVVAEWLRAKGKVNITATQPKVLGMEGNKGIV
jgi:sulfur-oxidizing protein SoxB